MPRQKPTSRVAHGGFFQEKARIATAVSDIQFCNCATGPVERVGYRDRILDNTKILVYVVIMGYTQDFVHHL